jgi:hypothetical protein
MGVDVDVGFACEVRWVWIYLPVWVDVHVSIGGWGGGWLCTRVWVCM